MRAATLMALVGCLFTQVPGTKIDTIAGTGTPGYAGDGGPALRAQLNQPFHCEFDRGGNLLIADAGNHCIRSLDLRTGVITTVVGSGKKGYTGDGGPATKATLNEPCTVVADTNGDLYLVDRLNFVIRKVDAKTQVISTVAGSGKKGTSGDGIQATEAAFVDPHDCCLDDKGGLLIADVGDWRVRRLDLKTGILSTFAGTGRPKDRANPVLGDGGKAAEAVVVGARAVCTDVKGNTYICEREGNRVRKVDTQGVITTVAGTGKTGYSGDGGDARQATFRGPKGVRCDKAGNVYVMDTENHAIRRIDVKTNVITTVAGGRKGSEGDGGEATKAGLARPHGCIADERGNLYIADTDNHRVRRVSPP